MAVRVRPAELQAGATEFAGHADTLGTYASTAAGLAGDLPAAFAGYETELAPIVAGLAEHRDRVNQLAERTAALGSAAGTTGSQTSELDQRNATSVTV